MHVWLYMTVYVFFYYQLNVNFALTLVYVNCLLIVYKSFSLLVSSMTKWRVVSYSIWAALFKFPEFRTESLYFCLQQLELCF